MTQKTLENSDTTKESLLNVSKQILRDKFGGDRPSSWHILDKCANHSAHSKHEKRALKHSKPKKQLKTGFEYATELLKEFDYDSYEHVVCSEFLNYIDEKKQSHIIAHGVTESGAEIDHDFGYPHRYTEQYIKGRFAKLYKLDEWYQANPDLKMTFVTLTSVHKSDKMLHLDESGLVHGISDTFRRLQKGKRLLMREMLRDHRRKVRHGERAGALDYVMVVEPHEDGYPHEHMIIFDTFTIEEQIRYRKLWESWCLGSFEHGLDFDERPRSEKIDSLRNYLMKYMAKSFIDYKTKYEKEPWNKEQLLFNAVAWKFGYRTWCASNHLSQIMSYHVDKVDGIDWQNVMLITPISEFELWKKPSAEDIEEEKTVVIEIPEIIPAVLKPVIHREKIFKYDGILKLATKCYKFISVECHFNKCELCPIG